MTIAEKALLEDSVALTTETVTLPVTFSALLNSDPPALAYTQRLTRTDGAQKTRTSSVFITDSQLFARAAELRAGDAIEIVVETDWASETLLSVLKSFSRLAAA